jgi:endonuclease/exonuclease/phosphatase family metal-dependent hydrolase
MKISVLQWNVLFNEKADNILNFIKQVGADIVCLQELTQTSAANPSRDLPAEIEQLGYEVAYVVTVDKPDFRMGNGIFSKFPIDSLRNVFVRHDVPGGTGPSNESRAYLEIQVIAGNKPLKVGTVHLSFTPGFIFLPEKKAEAKRFKTAIQDNKSNFIFSGDLNALPSSHFITELDQMFRPAGPDYTQATWTTKPFDYKGFKADKLNWRLDYVYTTPDIKVVSSRTVDTEYSDHLPILTEIEF